MKKTKHDDLPGAKTGFRFEKIIVIKFFLFGTREAVAEADKRGGKSLSEEGPRRLLMKRDPQP